MVHALIDDRPEVSQSVCAEDRGSAPEDGRGDGLFLAREFTKPPGELGEEQAIAPAIFGLIREKSLWMRQQ
ncbi:hypothetical protein [Reticulibacter mediterranei]|uniref:hypothetical protein n=1 Tax=Reticulibacter mediterranei TaxID=2778369 RepID=UPI001C68F63D|nr:hypothetical protein [Reticulibacter mediterranei]